MGILQMESFKWAMDFQMLAVGEISSWLLMIIPLHSVY